MDFHLNLSTETVDHALAADPLCVEPNRSLRDVMRDMQQQKRGAVLICEQGRVVGIFTERDALKAMATAKSFDVPIDSVMIKKPVTLLPTDTVGKAISKMSFGGYRHLPVVNGEGRAVGMLKVSGILHYLVEHFPSVVYTLPPAPHQMTQEREGA